MESDAADIGPVDDVARLTPEPLPPVIATVEERAAALLRAGWAPLPETAQVGPEVLVVGGASCILLTAAAAQVVPPGCAVLVMPEPRTVVLRGGGAFTLLRIPVRQTMPAVPGRVAVASDLARALAATVADDDARDAERQAATTALLLDEVARGEPAGFVLPEPTDPRLGRVTRRIWMAPGQALDVDAAATLAIMSRRTFTRHFSAQTTMGFDAWQRRLRLLSVVPRLEDGAPVKQVSAELGYDSVSAFIAAFRRAFGTTPRRFSRSGAPTRA